MGGKGEGTGNGVPPCPPPQRELPSSTLKLFEEQYDVERSSNMVVLKFGRPHFRHHHVLKKLNP